MVTFFTVFISAALAAAKVTIQGEVSRRILRNSADRYYFNGLLFAFIVLILLLYGGIPSASAETVMLAALGGACSVLFQASYVAALASGPVSLTVVLNNLGISLVMLYEAFVYDASITNIQILGSALLVVSMIMCISKNDFKQKIRIHWVFTVFVCMAFNGILAILASVHQHTDVKQETSQFVLYQYIFAALISFFLYFLIKQRNVGIKKALTSRGRSFDLNVLSVGGALTAAMLLCIFQISNLYIIRVVNPMILYPLRTGLNSLMMTLVGIFIFRDKLSVWQYIGIALGVASAVTLNM